MRWSQKVTHREAREHLGVETQRQWSDLAIERSTPLLFGIYSLTFLLGHQLYGQGSVSLSQTAWYKKEGPAFSDLLNAVRALIRKHQLFQVWTRHPILRNIQCPNELLSILEGIGHGCVIYQMAKVQGYNFTEVMSNLNLVKPKRFIDDKTLILFDLHRLSCSNQVVVFNPPTRRKGEYT